MQRLYLCYDVLDKTKKVEMEEKQCVFWLKMDGFWTSRELDVSGKPVDRGWHHLRETGFSANQADRLIDAAGVGLCQV